MSNLVLSSGHAAMVAEAENYRIQKPKTYGTRLQNSLAKSVSKYASDAVEAAKTAAKASMIVLNTKAEEEANSENIRVAVNTSTLAEEKMSFNLRRAKLASRYESVEDFQYLSGLNDSETKTYYDLVIRLRETSKLPYRKQVEEIAIVRTSFLKFRQAVIDRIAKDAEKTDEALSS